MATSRPFLLRLALAGIGGILLCLGAYVGLGWLVWAEPRWAVELVGARFLRLHDAYSRAMVGLLPGDRDQDGICDGYELFYRTNPQDPTDHAGIHLAIDTQGILADDPRPSYRSLNLSMGYTGGHLTPVGQRVTVRRRFVSFRRLQSVMPRSFRIRITPPLHAQIATPGGVLSSEPLVLPVLPKAGIIFDLQVTAATAAAAPEDRQLVIANAATGEVIDNPLIDPVWTGPIIPATAALAPPSDPILTLRSERDPVAPWWRVRWPAAPAGTEELLLEVARDAPGGDWSPVCRYAGDETGAVISQSVFLQDDAYRGPLKFRVVPFRTLAP